MVPQSQWCHGDDAFVLRRRGSLSYRIQSQLHLWFFVLRSSFFAGVSGAWTLVAPGARPPEDIPETPPVFQIAVTCSAVLVVLMNP